MVFACNGDERQLQEEEDAAYAAGCDEGRIVGTLAGADDGKECRERADVPNEAAQKGMAEYCGGEASDDDQPCHWWKIGYLDCWRAEYDMSYPVGWDKGACDADTGI